MDNMNLAVKQSASGVVIEVSDSTKYQQLVGRTGYKILINYLDANQQISIPMTLISDGSDLDAGNGNYVVSQT